MLKKAIRTVFSLVLVLSLLVSLSPNTAKALDLSPTIIPIPTIKPIDSIFSSLYSSKSFTLMNMSGSAITEVYLYPSYNSSWGDPRNTQWIYNGREATISFSNSEYNMSYTTWNMRIGINKGRYVSYYLWEDVSPSDLVSSGTVTLLSNSYGGYTLDYNAGNSGTNYTNKNYFTIYNYSGDPIIEIYLYPMNSSNFGKMRNSGWISSGDNVTVYMTSNELSMNIDWCMRIGVRKNGRAYYTYWNNVDISDLINYGPITVYTGSNGWLSYSYD